MAVRLKSRWHRSRRARRGAGGASRPKGLEDLASAVAFNIWKLAKDVFTHMEREGFRFPEDRQAVDLMNEVMAFCLHVVDRMVYGRLAEEERARLVNAVAGRLMDAMVENETELLGPGDYRPALVALLNERLGEYAACSFDEEGPGYDFKVLLGQHAARLMAPGEEKWVVEQVVDVEAPRVLEKLMPMVENLLGLRQRGKEKGPAGAGPSRPA